MGKLFYIRHGQASVFSDNYDQLSELGYQQSESIGSFFVKEKIKIHKVFYGPLERHRQTLAAIEKTAEYISQADHFEMAGLKEHQGYSILKLILPQLVEIDPKIKELVHIPYSNQKEQIKHHIRIYDHFALRWSQGFYDDIIPDSFQSWDSFYNIATQAFREVKSCMLNGDNVLVVTSGGPKSVACGKVLDLSPGKTIELSSMIYNASITSFYKKEENVVLSYFNHITHLPSLDQRTLV